MLFHDEDGARCLDIGGRGTPGFARTEALGRDEIAGDDIRLTYVALTRAQSQVVAWWAPSWDEVNGGLSRLLREPRARRQAGVPDLPDLKTASPTPTRSRKLRRWQAAGGPLVERTDLDRRRRRSRADAAPGRARRARTSTGRSTSTGGARPTPALVRAAEESGGVTSEPELSARDDEVRRRAGRRGAGARRGRSRATAGASPRRWPTCPRAPRSARWCTACSRRPTRCAADLEAELAATSRSSAVLGPVDTPADELAAALVPLHHTSLGPLAGGATLGDDRRCPTGCASWTSRSRWPVATSHPGVEVSLADVGALLEQHLPTDDPLRPYAARLRAPGLGGQSLRGYLSGSIDVVLRVPGPDGGPATSSSTTRPTGSARADAPLTAAAYSRDRLAEAMLHSDYPLQALLYVVVVHRYLRWRQPGYDPARHLGGVLYLYVRGMCGPETPEDDGHPAGVFSWLPPTALVTALSDLLDGAR